MMIPTLTDILADELAKVWKQIADDELERLAHGQVAAMPTHREQDTAC